ncbi:hypothetical protein [Klebsiella pneumoniae]|uniref:hypothetical protein n=1 Tax=Klebsiella pneumoniae TaxID=573 RepID=UPI00388FEF68
MADAFSRALDVDPRRLLDQAYAYGVPFRSLERGWRRGATRSSYRGRDQAGATDVILDIKRLLLSPGNTSISPENIAGQSLSVGFRPFRKRPQTGNAAETGSSTPTDAWVVQAVLHQPARRHFRPSAAPHSSGRNRDAYS